MREILPLSVSSREEQPSILVVEDDEILCSLLAEYLKLDGWHVLEAHDGEQALQIIEANYHNIVLVLFDRCMPGLSGYELFRKSHALHSGIRHVMLSGTGQDQEINELLANGLDAFETKPILRDDLLEVINGVLEGTASNA